MLVVKYGVQQNETYNQMSNHWLCTSGHVPVLFEILWRQTFTVIRHAIMQLANEIKFTDQG